MSDDIRNHSNVPSPHEREWMEARPLRALLRVAVQAAVALAVGLSVSHMLEGSSQPSVAVVSVPVPPAP